FLILDGQAPGPGLVLKMPFEVKVKSALDASMVQVTGKQINYVRALEGKESVFGNITGFGPTAKDYDFTIESKGAGAGLKITGDRPLASLSLWSIRSNVSLEPFIAMMIEPGQEFTWKYTYTYYV